MEYLTRTITDLDVQQLIALKVSTTVTECLLYFDASERRNKLCYCYTHVEAAEHALCPVLSDTADR